MSDNRPVILITGACGGMGQACARLLGHRYRLALTDMDQARLDILADPLADEGHEVLVRIAGDMGDITVPATIVRAARAEGRLAGVVHAAGLSPALAPWDKILMANLVATERLLQAIETEDGPLVAVLIASIAGHGALADPRPDIDRLFDEAPLSADLLQRAAPLLQQMVRVGDRYGAGSPAYNYSKAAVIRMCERRAAAWARVGRRIVSISPGTMRTPMGVKEAADNPAARAAIVATPFGMGSVLHIANAVDFLLSERAGFITGTALRIDGGLVPAIRQTRAAEG